MHSHFFSCDWGTTRFRLRLVEVPAGTILAEVSTSKGASSLAATASGADRALLFQNVLRRHIQELSQGGEWDVSRVPVVISGMASSSIGWKDLPYVSTPFSLDGRDLGLCRMEDVADWSQPVYLVSGVRSERDVMRGEETELIGLQALRSDLFPGDRSTWVLLPGTHSKHVLVRERQAVDFRTYMTGELFQLLRRQSSLKHPQSTEESADLGTCQLANAAFREGVALSKSGGLTSSLFQVRVSQLLQSAGPDSSEALLSGLLIGNELWSLVDAVDAHTRIVLCAPSKLQAPYRLALEAVGLSQRTTEISQDEAVRLSALGQWQIFRSHEGNAGQWRTPTRLSSSAAHGVSNTNLI